MIKSKSKWKNIAFRKDDDLKVTIMRNTIQPALLKKKVFWYWKDNARFPRSAIYFTIEGMVDRNGEEIWVKGIAQVVRYLNLIEEGIIE